ncbi:MAG: SpoIIE family protein phosphatase [Acidobacteriia bacterium]|nr:SpoIIE family protein phosphatase [Terriglobia bacterium]
MESPAAAAEKAKAARKGYISAFGEAVARLTSAPSGEEVLSSIPTILVAEFGAARGELWLWDESSGSAYLTHAAGLNVGHRKDYRNPGQGFIGAVIQSRQGSENVDLPSLGDAEADFAALTKLAYASAYPLLAKGRLVGVLVAYTQAVVSDTQLEWWQLYAEISSVAAQDALAAQESQKTITQLSLLFEATRLLNSTLDLAELLDLILKIARTEVKADRGTVFLVDTKHKQLWSIVASGLDHQEIRVPFGKGVAGKVAETGQEINVEDAYTLEFFDRSFDQKFGYKTGSLLCLPIRHHTGEVVGVIQLLNKTTGSRFSVDDQDFLSKLSGHMAMALENARLHREVVEKQRLEKELALARGIQRSLLPDAPPVVPGYDIAVINEPCYEVGGDYYDFLNLGPQSLLLVVADVEGKGVSSALVMSNLQATLRALVMHLHSLEVLTLSLNEMICNDTKSQKFLSMFLGLVDTRRNGLHYINAGHVPPILIDGETGKYQTLEDGGTVIGLFLATEYERGAAKLKAGDILVCCTDGIMEANDEKDDEFGTERLAASVFQHRNKSAQELVDSVLADVNAFSVRGTHVDDKVLMVLKVTGSGAVAAATAKKHESLRHS